MLLLGIVAIQCEVGINLCQCSGRGSGNSSRTCGNDLHSALGGASLATSSGTHPSAKMVAWVKSIGVRGSVLGHIRPRCSRSQVRAWTGGNDLESEFSPSFMRSSPAATDQIEPHLKLVEYWVFVRLIGFLCASRKIRSCGTTLGYSKNCYASSRVDLHPSGLHLECVDHR